MPNIRSTPRSRRMRRGITFFWMIFSLVAVAVVLGILFGPKYLAGSKTTMADVPTVAVKSKTFNHSVIEPGEVESSNNTEIRCEVQARNTSGVMILEIVPSGTNVQPGDFLVRFDSSALENEMNLQQIACNNSKATLSQSKAAYDTAVITREEYIQGINKQEEQLIQSEVFVAEENLRRAEEYARYSERLAARGYVTAVQVEADRFAVDKAKKDLDVAQTKLRVLKDFTRAKMIKTLDANIESAEAKMQADENSFKLEQSKLQLIENQIEKCRVISPVAGKVVYANVQGGRSQSEVLIQEGTMIRERQPVIRIPDLGKMQVMAKINESRIGYVAAGQRATVRLDAFPDVALSGSVTRVDEYPIPTGWMSPNIKQYSTYVQIDHPPQGMIRPGLTAKVEIHVDTLNDALVVPISSIFQNSGEYYCMVKEHGTIVPKWVELGSSNETEVVIRHGLNAGEEIVESPDAFIVAEMKYPAPPPGKSTAEKSEQFVKDARSKAVPSGGQVKGAKPDPATLVKALLEKYDADHNGELALNEIPAEQRERYASDDLNKDGKLDRAELLMKVQKSRGPGKNKGDDENGPPVAGYEAGGPNGGGKFPPNAEHAKPAAAGTTP